MEHIDSTTVQRFCSVIHGEYSWLIFTSTVIGFLLVYCWRHGTMDVSTALFHGESCIRITTADGATPSFPDICRIYCSTCQLTRYLFDGHLQTLWTLTGSSEKSIFFKRRIFEHRDPAYPGTFAVDFATRVHQKPDVGYPPRTTAFDDYTFSNLRSNDTKPMLVVLHGLSGGSHEGYVLDTIARFLSDRADWEACVVISRGCGRTKLSSSILFNGRATWDLRQTVNWMKTRFPNRSLYGIGFSLGATILTHYVAEEGENCVFKAAVVVSNLWDMEVCSRTMQQSWAGRNIYSRGMAASVKSLLKSHAETISKVLDLSMKDMEKLKYLHECDRAIQCAAWDYPDEVAYYRHASTTESIANVRIPLFAINAIDDPIAVTEGIPRKEFLQSPFGVLCTTDVGGHIGWFQPNRKRWFVEVTYNILQHLAISEVHDRIHT